MKVYKGMNRDMVCTLGKGQFQYEIGKTYREEKAKTARTGFHCTENPFLIMRWYSPDKQLGSRYFKCEASGSIDEDKDDDKISCTELTILKELNVHELVMEGIMYMMEHPMRDWKGTYGCVKLEQDEAKAETREEVAIARGLHPRAKGVEGSVICLIREREAEDGLMIDAARMKRVAKTEEGMWFCLSRDGRMVIEL